MKKNTSWKFMDELSITFQSSVSGAGEFGLGSKLRGYIFLYALVAASGAIALHPQKP